MTDRYQPKPEHKFTFGRLTMGNPCRDKDQQDRLRTLAK